MIRPGLVARARAALGRFILGMQQRSFSFFIPSSEAGQAQTQPINYRRASEDGYKKAVWVYRCVNEIANRISSVPFNLVHKKNGEPYQGSHPLRSLLNKPNTEQSWTEFLRAQSILLNVSGNNYYDISERIGKAPANIYLLRPDRMKIVPGKTRKGKDASAYIDRYEYNVDAGNPDKIPPTDILHQKKFDPSNDWYGLSPIQVATYAIDTETQASAWNYNTFKNQARPSGVLCTDGMLSDEQFKTMAEEVRVNWQGTNNAGRLVILEGGLKWIQTALSQRDADYILLKKLTREEICAVFGVPPILVGILDRATYNNIKEAEPIFWSQTILPELDAFLDFWNTRICPLYGDDIALAYDLSDVKALKEAQDYKDKRASQAFAGGIIMQNEAREEMGFEPHPHGDFFLMPSTGTVWPMGEAPPTGETQAPATTKALRQLESIITQSDYCMETRANILNLKDTEIPAYLKIFTQRVDKYAKKGAGKIQEILSAYYQDVEQKLRTMSGEPNVKALLAGHDKESQKALKEFYTDYYTEGLKYFMGLTRKDLKKSARIWLPDLEVRDDQKVSGLADFVQEWLADVTGEMVVDVNDFTKLQIKRIIEGGLKEGKTSKEMADEILELDEIGSYLRAARISITEAHAIASAGNYYAMVGAELGEGLIKKWHTNMDGRERDPHGDITGQRRKMKEAFKSGTGNKLMFPGDRSLGAGADDIVHCRCCTTYDTTAIGGQYGG